MLMARMLGPLTPAQAIWLAMLSGFGEELLFRGALWPHLGLVGGAVLFGILHTVPVRGLAFYPVFAFLAGLDDTVAAHGHAVAVAGGVAARRAAARRAR